VDLIDCPFSCGEQHEADARFCPGKMKPLPRRPPPQVQQPPPPPADPAPAADPDPAPGHARLALALASDRVLRLEIGATVVLGRDPASPIADACRGNVSWQHAEVTARDERTVVLVDHRSTNGTFVNGLRVALGTDRQLLKNDVVEFANERPLAITIVEDVGSS